MRWNVTIKSQVAVSRKVQSLVFIVAATAAAVGSGVVVAVVMGQYVYVVLFKILISIRFYSGPKIKLAASDLGIVCLVYVFDRSFSAAAPSKWTIIAFGVSIQFVCICVLRSCDIVEPTKQQKLYSDFLCNVAPNVTFFGSLRECVSVYVCVGVEMCLTLTSSEGSAKTRARSLCHSFVLQFPV